MRWDANIDKVVEGLWRYFPLEALTAGRNRDGDRKISSTQLDAGKTEMDGFSERKVADGV